MGCASGASSFQRGASPAPAASAVPTCSDPNGRSRAQARRVSSPPAGPAERAMARRLCRPHRSLPEAAEALPAQGRRAEIPLLPGAKARAPRGAWVGGLCSRRFHCRERGGVSLESG
ncbi:unnamed protein product [Coccothraustes coccothraustes]